MNGIITLKKRAAVLLGLILAGFSLPAMASSLDAVEWLDGEGLLLLTSTENQPELVCFDQGTRCRIVLIGASLPEPIASPTASSVLKSVFITHAGAKTQSKEVRLDAYFKDGPHQWHFDKVELGYLLRFAPAQKGSAEQRQTSQPQIANKTASGVLRPAQKKRVSRVLAPARSTQDMPAAATDTRVVIAEPVTKLAEKKTLTTTSARPLLPVASASAPNLALKRLAVTLETPQKDKAVDQPIAGQQNNTAVAVHNLVHVQPLVLANGNSAIDLVFENGLPNLQHAFKAAPNRIQLEIENASTSLPLGRKAINRAGLEAYAVHTIIDGVRLELESPAARGYAIKPLANGYRILMAKTNPAVTVRPLAKASPQPLRPVVATAVAAKPIEATQPDVEIVGMQDSVGQLDFRRLADGSGRVIVNVTGSNIRPITTDTRNGVSVRFVGGSVSTENERFIEVNDFATPVSQVDLVTHDQDATLRIAVNGLFDYSTQVLGEQFYVDVTPKKALKPKVNDTEKTYSGEKLSLNFQKIPVRAALQVIADFTDLNIIASDEVTGELSLRLNDVPWDQALDLILQSKNLDQRQSGNVVRVAPAETLREQELQATASAQEVKALEPLQTDLITVRYSKAADIAALLKSIKPIGIGISAGDDSALRVNELKTEDNSLLSSRGSVTVDERTNSVLIQDTAVKINEIRELIGRLDVPVKQVLIETRIVEATDDFSRNLGARLGFTNVTVGASVPGNSDGSLGTVFGGGSIENNNEVRTENTILYPDSLSVNLPADGINNQNASSYAFQISKIGAGYLSLLDLEISALQAEGKGRVIANPKVLTTNQTEAVIQQGQERVFSDGTETITKQAVLGLTVTPHITPNNEVILDVEVTNDSFAASDTLNTKRISTQAMLKNGETVVIGGIYQQSENNSVVKTPFLGDLPVIGNLFKKRNKSKVRTELLVFITPKIIDNGY